VEGANNPSRTSPALSGASGPHALPDQLGAFPTRLADALQMALSLGWVVDRDDAVQVGTAILPHQQNVDATVRVGKSCTSAVGSRQSKAIDGQLLVRGHVTGVLIQGGRMSMLSECDDILKEDK